MLLRFLELNRHNLPATFSAATECLKTDYKYDSHELRGSLHFKNQDKSCTFMINGVEK